jgi:glycosyltransferase involved in cell wall biosynthesis
VNGMPIVSVAIRAYRRDWLPGAIASVLAQTWRDLELVIYDDAGDLEDIVAGFTDPRLRYVRAAKKLEASGRFAAAIALCRGRYIGVLDDDDRYEPRFLERLVAVLESDERIGAAVCHVMRDVSPGTRSLEPAPGPPGRLTDVVRNILLCRFAMTPSMMLLRRAALDDAEAFQAMPDGVAPDAFVNVGLALTGWHHVLVDDALAIRGDHAGRINGSPAGYDYTVATLEQLRIADPDLDRLRRRELARWRIRRAAHRVMITVARIPVLGRPLIQVARRMVRLFSAKPAQLRRT